MINAITWLLVCQFVGEVVVTLLDLPVPGAVVGMLLLLVALLVRRPDTQAPISRVADGLLSHLQLFFIPAGVGVVVYLGTLREDALPIGVAMVVSWLVGLVVVGLVVQLWVGRGPAGTSGSGGLGGTGGPVPAGPGGPGSPGGPEAPVDGGEA